MRPMDHWRIEKSRLTLLLAVGLCLAGFLVQAREWTSSDGKKLEADFVSTTGDQVTLKLLRGGNEKTATVTLGKRPAKVEEASP